MTDIKPLNWMPKPGVGMAVARRPDGGMTPDLHRHVRRNAEGVARSPSSIRSAWSVARATCTTCGS